MGRAMWVCVGIIVVTMALASCGWALERELSGVRLGDRALALLDKPGYGEPDYIGPIGTISVTGAAGTGTAGQTAGRVGRTGMQAGPSGPSGGAGRGTRGGMGGGMRGGRGGRMGRMGGMEGANVPNTNLMTAQGQFAITLTAASSRRGMGRQGGMMGGGRGGMMGGRGGMGGATGMRGGAVRGRQGGTGTGRTRTTAGGAGVEGPGMYWYYRRPGGAVVVLSLDLEGRVTQITLSGLAPTPGGRTSNGIGLGNSYMDIIARNGYPDQTASSGSVLTMSFVDDGVRFTLDAMRVREIAIGAGVATGQEEAPVTGTGEIEQPPAGMSVEELRGYL